MRKSLAISLVVAAAALLVTPANADIIPPIGLAPGSEYQLIFVTADATAPTSSDISTYNSFVTSEAALSPSLPSATWDAVGSTATVSAVDNAPNVEVNGSYLPVYNTQGIEVSGAAGLYSGSLLSGPDYDQYGAGTPYNVLWTGSTGLGQASPTPLGGGLYATVGIPSLTDSTWLNYESFTTYVGNVEYTRYLAVYALSTPLVATPEPATVTLLGSALSLIVGYRLLRRRRTA